MARRETVLIAAVFAAAFLENSCSGKDTAVLVTDRPETAIYAQIYNSSQDKYKVNVRFVGKGASDPDMAKSADMVMASGLNNEKTLSRFENLSLLYKNGIKSGAFYPALLEAGRKKNRQLFLPVSFNLLLIVSKNKTGAGSAANHLIEISALNDEGMLFNVYGALGPVRLGFSPLWDKKHDYIMNAAALYSVNFKEADGKDAYSDILDLDISALNKVIGMMKDRIEKSSGGIQAEDDFIFRYFFDPPSGLLIDERILFAAIKSDEYWLSGTDRRDELEFSYLSNNGKIYADDGYTMFAVYKNSGAKKASYDFAIWFFNENTQAALLEKNFTNHLNGTIFGISGGFSALKTVSNYYFPKYYDGLLGRTPPEDAIFCASRLPLKFDELKEDVIIPFILDSIRGSGDKRDLHRRIEQWRNNLNKEFSDGG